MSNYTSIIGGSLFSGGIVGEIAKDPIPQNLMDVDIFFGLFMPYIYLTVTGLIAIVGTVILILGYLRDREKSKEDEFPDSVVKGSSKKKWFKRKDK